MMDFMKLLEQAAEENRMAYGINDGPELVARAQAADRKAANDDPMLMASLVQQRPLQAAAPVAQMERKKTEPVWWFFIQGILLGASMAALLLIGILA